MTGSTASARGGKSGPWLLGAALLVVAGAVYVLATQKSHHPASVARPIPRIDVHVHVAPALAEEAVALFHENGIELALNASGGAPGQGLEYSKELAGTTHGHLQYWCNIGLARIDAPDFAEYARQTLETCKQEGAVGLKLYKALGLGIRDSTGTLVPVDDPRLDVMFETAGRLGMPVLIHSGDPVAFFRPPTPDNERYEELSAHPAWSFYGEYAPGKPWPSWEEVYTQFEHRVARHPHTVFLGAHFCNDAEDPERVGRMLERYPNLICDVAARVPEFGRKDPTQMHAFFMRWQDRILYGSDTGVTPDGLTLGSRGVDHDPPDRVRPFFDLQWRYFETADRRIPSPTPIQGRWTLNGVHLPRDVLEKIYHRNAEHWLHVEIPGAPDAGAE